MTSAVFEFGGEAEPTDLGNLPFLLAMTAITTTGLYFADASTRDGFVTMAGMVAVVMAAEAVFSGVGKSSIHRLVATPSNRRDMIYFLVTFIGWMAYITGAAWAVIGMIPGHEFGATLWGNLTDTYSLNVIDHVPVWARFVVNLLILDLIGTLLHWADHHVPVLWWFHESHHSSTDMIVVNNFRGHPLESVVQTIITSIPMMILGVRFNLYEVPVFFAAFRVHQLLLHANLDWDFGWFGRWVIVSPLHHRQHHKRHGVGGNYSNMFVVWDRLMGTYEAPATIDTPVGVECDRCNKANPLMEPFVFLWSFWA